MLASARGLETARYTAALNIRAGKPLSSGLQMALYEQVLLLVAIIALVLRREPKPDSPAIPKYINYRPPRVVRLRTVRSRATGTPRVETATNFYR